MVRAPMTGMSTRRSWIGFGALPTDVAAHLALPPGYPCAVVRRKAFNLAGRCVEWRTTWGDANAFHYTVHLT